MSASGGNAKSRVGSPITSDILRTCVLRHLVVQHALQVPRRTCLRKPLAGHLAAGHPPVGHSKLLTSGQVVGMVHPHSTQTRALRIAQ